MSFFESTDEFRSFDATLECLRIHHQQIPNVVQNSGRFIGDEDLEVVMTTSSGKDTLPFTSVLKSVNPGVNLLLGRNGTGKSHFLKSLCIPCTTSSTMSIDLIFRLPTEEQHTAWRESVNQLTATLMDRFRRIAPETEDVPEAIDNLIFFQTRLQAMEFFIRWASGNARRSDSRFWNLSAEDLLRHFGFSQSTIQYWSQSAFRSDPLFGDPGDPGMISAPKSFSHRVQAGSFFLNALNSSNIRARGPHPIQAEFETESTEWLNDPKMATLVGPAYEQLITSSEQVILELTGSFRFVAPFPSEGPLLSLIEERENALGGRPDGFMDIIPTFPFDLFDVVQFNGEKVVISSSFMYENGVPPRIPFESQLLNLSNDVCGQIHALVSKYMYWFLNSIVFRDASATADILPASLRNRLDFENERQNVDLEQILITGFGELTSVLSQLGGILDEMGIGISDLRIRRLSTLIPEGRSIIRLLGLPEGDVEKRYFLQWREGLTGQWLEVEQASQGQQDAILILLAMAFNPDPRDSRTRFVLIDEFDQHLHPTAACSLLSAANQEAHKSRTIAILSTHSTGSLSHPLVRQSPRIYAQRSHDGYFQYSDGSSLSLDEITNLLGLNTVDAFRLTRLFVLVEGDHEDLILRHLFGVGIGSGFTNQIDIVNARGTWSFAGIWENLLSFLNAPVLVVYDKKSTEFESAWNDKESWSRYFDKWQRFVESGNRAAKRPPPLPDSLNSVATEIGTRKRERRSRPGDDEIQNVFNLVRLLLPSSNFRSHQVSVASARIAVERLHFFGIPHHDIVDLLDIKHFQKASAYQNWDAARSSLRGVSSMDFKRELGLNNRSISEALKKDMDLLATNPILQELYDRIIVLAGNSEEANLY